MEMTDEKLIEVMSKAEFESVCERCSKTIDWDDISDDVKSEWFDDAKAILSVIRTHYDLVEKGKVHEKVHNDDCPAIKGAPVCTCWQHRRLG